MPSAKVDVNGKVTQLDLKPEPDEQITEDNVKDGTLLARFLLQLFRDVAALKRRWVPRRLDFEDISFGATSFLKDYPMQHNFNGRVRWWLVDWSAGVPPVLVRGANTNANTLVLLSNAVGTGTIRVEESG